MGEDLLPHGVPPVSPTEPSMLEAAYADPMRTKNPRRFVLRNVAVATVAGGVIGVLPSRYHAESGFRPWWGLLLAAGSGVVALIVSVRALRLDQRPQSQAVPADGGVGWSLKQGSLGARFLTEVSPRARRIFYTVVLMGACIGAAALWHAVV